MSKRSAESATAAAEADTALAESDKAESAKSELVETSSTTAKKSKSKHSTMSERHHQIFLTIMHRVADSIENFSALTESLVSAELINSVEAVAINKEPNVYFKMELILHALRCNDKPDSLYEFAALLHQLKHTDLLDFFSPVTFSEYEKANHKIGNEFAFPIGQRKTTVIVMMESETKQAVLRIQQVCFKVIM
jgi:hypothetical protein